VKQAERNAGKRSEGPTTVEREELIRLRRENYRLRQERDIKVYTSSYYAWRGRPASARAAADLDHTRRIRTTRVTSRGTNGAPRVHVEFNAAGIAIGNKRVARLVWLPRKKS
jgi:hypothetical protein